MNKKDLIKDKEIVHKLFELMEKAEIYNISLTEMLNIAIQQFEKCSKGKNVRFKEMLFSE